MDPGIIPNAASRRSSGRKQLESFHDGQKLPRLPTEATLKVNVQGGMDDILQSTRSLIMFSSAEVHDIKNVPCETLYWSSNQPDHRSRPVCTDPSHLLGIA